MRQFDFSHQISLRLSYPLSYNFYSLLSYSLFLSASHSWHFLSSQHSHLLSFICIFYRLKAIQMHLLHSSQIVFHSAFLSSLTNISSTDSSHFPLQKPSAYFSLKKSESLCQKIIHHLQLLGIKRLFFLINIFDEATLHCLICAILTILVSHFFWIDIFCWGIHFIYPPLMFSFSKFRKLPQRLLTY